MYREIILLGRTVNPASWDQQREGGLSDLFNRFIRFLCSPFSSIPPSFSLSYVSGGRVTISPAVLSPLSCSFPTLHLPHHTYGHKLLYNAHAGPFCQADFIVTPLGPPFYHWPTELWHVQRGLASCVWTRVNGCCANMSDYIKSGNKRLTGNQCIKRDVNLYEYIIWIKPVQYLYGAGLNGVVLKRRRCNRAKHPISEISQNSQPLDKTIHIWILFLLLVLLF